MEDLTWDKVKENLLRLDTDVKGFNNDLVKTIDDIYGLFNVQEDYYLKILKDHNPDDDRFVIDKKILSDDLQLFIDNSDSELYRVSAKLIILYHLATIILFLYEMSIIYGISPDMINLLYLFDAYYKKNIIGPAIKSMEELIGSESWNYQCVEDDNDTEITEKDLFEFYLDAANGDFILEILDPKGNPENFFGEKFKAAAVKKAAAGYQEMIDKVVKNLSILYIVTGTMLTMVNVYAGVLGVNPDGNLDTLLESAIEFFGIESVKKRMFLDNDVHYFTGIRSEPSLKENLHIIKGSVPLYYPELLKKITSDWKKDITFIGVSFYDNGFQEEIDEVIMPKVNNNCVWINLRYIREDEVRYCHMLFKRGVINAFNSFTVISSESLDASLEDDIRTIAAGYFNTHRVFFVDPIFNTLFPKRKDEDERINFIGLVDYIALLSVRGFNSIEDNAFYWAFAVYGTKAYEFGINKFPFININKIDSDYYKEITYFSQKMLNMADKAKKNDLIYDCLGKLCDVVAEDENDIKIRSAVYRSVITSWNIASSDRETMSLAMNKLTSNYLEDIDLLKIKMAHISNFKDFRSITTKIKFV